MRTIITLLLLLLLTVLPHPKLMAAAPQLQSQNQTPTILEVAPLQGFVGQPALRFEHLFWPRVGLSAAYESWTTPSERDDFTDRHGAFDLTALYYPMGLSSYPVFLGAGLRAEQATIGRQRARDIVTWARTDADEVDDHWVNHDVYVSVTQTIGYRLLAARLATVSFRMVRDDLISTSSSNDTSGVVDGSPAALATRGRDPVTLRFMLHAGLWLP